MAVNSSNVTDYNVLGAYGEVWWASCRTAAVFYGTIASLACLLNSVALCVILCSKRAEAATFYLINLVIVDLITPALQMILVIKDPDCYHTYRSMFFNDPNQTTDIVSPSLTQCLQSVAFYGYLLNAVFMTLDRFVATWRPFAYQRLVTKTRVALSIACVWFLSVVMGFLPYIITLTSLQQLKISHYTFNVTLMEAFFAEANTNVKTSLKVLFFTACVIFCWILFVYIVIFRAIRRHHKFLQLTRQQSQGIVKGALTSALIVGSYAVCWLPFGITFIVLGYTKRDHIDVQTYGTLIQWKDANYGLVLLNSVCDPIIYIALNTKFRTSLVRRLKTCGCDCEPGRNRRQSAASNRVTLSTSSGRTQRTRSAELVNVELCERML